MSEAIATTAVPEVPPASQQDDRDKGIARIKKEYLVDIPTANSNRSNNVHRIDDDAAETGTSTAQPTDSRDGPRDAKRRRTQGGGQNKNRQFPKANDRGPKMCRQWELTGECDRPQGCKFAHSWQEYFKSKPQDVHYDPLAEFNTTEPFVVTKSSEIVQGGEDVVGLKLDTSTVCPVKRDLGWCPYGMKCRFLGSHLRKVSDGDKDKGKENERYGGWELTDHIIPEEKNGWKQGETNWSDWEMIKKLRFHKYEYKYSKEYLKRIEPHKEFTHDRNLVAESAPVGEMNEEDAFNESTTSEGPVKAGGSDIPGENEAMDVPMRPEEKRRLNWDNGIYLAPLTTVGNLPFRRLCIDYGATITCSEMALSQQLLTGQADEWALVRRHASEKQFGIQVAGGYPNIMVPTAEMIARELGQGGGVDFVDVNLGCPIDLVFNQGAGSALMDSQGRLGKILVGMNRALGDIPLTVKFRTGVANGKPNAHKLIPKFATEWGASAMTLHGRSRQQRYSKLADWAYIKSCATTLRETLSDAGLPAVPMFGNGDCFSAQQYYEEKEGAGVDGVMVARGALIKPWIFTEIKERREWDISATERLEGIRKYAEFGLSHWGSDTQGINTTRRFLLEALSFQHRYVPLGLLERLPAQMNERPPAYRGRSELENLLSSPNCEDWVKISEMFLGKVGGDYKFVPKHKTNSYGSEEAQG